MKVEFLGSTSVSTFAARLLTYSYPTPRRLGVQRLRTLQEKKNAQAKAARRDIAHLLEKGRIETARIKTENSTYVLLSRCLGLYREHTAVINEDIYVELLELLELYCELLIARFGLLDQK